MKQVSVYIFCILQRQLNKQLSKQKAQKLYIVKRHRSLKKFTPLLIFKKH